MPYEVVACYQEFSWKLILINARLFVADRWPLHTSCDHCPPCVDLVAMYGRWIELANLNHIDIIGAWSVFGGPKTTT